MPEGVSYEGVFGYSGQQSYGGSVSRSIAAAPSVSYGAGGGGLTASYAMEEECDDMASYSPVHAASLAGISEYLGARPSEFRAVVLEAVEALNQQPEILEPGTIELILTLDGGGRITAVTVEEDTVEVEELIETIRSALMGKSIPDASAGRVTVTINIL